MYKRILVAADGSATSDKALVEAIDLANDQHAQLKIVYTIDDASIYTAADVPNAVGIEQAWIDAGHKILEAAKKKAQAAGIEAETKLLETDAMGEKISDAIVNEARAWPADLLVAGTHGRRGLSHLIMGSVAEGIVRTCPVPLLLVRGK